MVKENDVMKRLFIFLGILSLFFPKQILAGPEEDAQLLLGLTDSLYSASRPQSIYLLQQEWRRNELFEILREEARIELQNLERENSRESYFILSNANVPISSIALVESDGILREGTPLSDVGALWSISCNKEKRPFMLGIKIGNALYQWIIDSFDNGPELLLFQKNTDYGFILELKQADEGDYMRIPPFSMGYEYS